MPGLEVDTQNPFREAASKKAAPQPEPDEAGEDEGEDGDYIDAWEVIEAAQVELRDALKGLRGGIDEQDEDTVMDFLDAAFSALGMMQDALDEEDFVLDSDFNPMQEAGEGAALAEAEGEAGGEKKAYKRGTHTKRGSREHVKAGTAAYEKKAAGIKAKRDALVNKLKSNPKVKDPEALAAWIGMRMGGISASKGKGEGK